MPLLLHVLVISSWERIFAACLHLMSSFSSMFYFFVSTLSQWFIFLFSFFVFFNFCDVAQVASFWQLFCWNFFCGFFLIIHNRIFFFLNLFSQNGENSPTQKITVSPWDFGYSGFYLKLSLPHSNDLMKENIVLDAIDSHWSEPGLLTDEHQHSLLISSPLAT
jgi:hypothetical protein